jgi:hypothetical protein
MNITNAVLTSIQAVEPVSRIGGVVTVAGGAGGTAAAALQGAANSRIMAAPTAALSVIPLHRHRSTAAMGARCISTSPHTRRIVGMCTFYST